MIKDILFRIGLVKMDRNDFLYNIELLTNSFVKNVILSLNLNQEDEINIKKTSFELKIFFLVNFEEVFRNYFPDNSYNDIINFFYEEIFFDSSIAILFHKVHISHFGELKYQSFINDRCNFHREGKLEVAKYHKIKNRFPLPNDYSQLLITLFNNPLKEIDEIKSINSNSFLNPFESVNKEVLTSNIYKIKLVYQENLIKAISRTKKW
jgi:hypothetical protein